MKPKRPPRTTTLAAKIIRILVISLTAGLGIAALMFGLVLTSSRQEVTRESLNQEAAMLQTAIENFMLPGEAPIAVQFFREIEGANPKVRISLYRRNGEIAFSDNRTIQEVNANLRRERFSARSGPALEMQMPADGVHFPKAVSMPPQDVFFRQQDESAVYIKIYRPLINLPKCTACHGSDHTIRGVIGIQFDISSFVRSENVALASGGAGFLFLTVVLAAALGSIMNRGVAAPVAAIGRVCERVAQGDFDGVVAVRGSDEIARLGRQVNDMVRGLRERSELTKYVSAGTIGAIQDSQEPKRVRKTLLFTDVRGFTSYTGSHDPERVVGILNRLLEEQSRIIHEHQGDVDKFVGDEVVAVFSGQDSPARACAAALAIMAAAQEGRESYDGLALGAGIACGEVIQGMIGSARRADFTVIGASVNIAARLCGLAKPGQILVAREARDAVGPAPGYVFQGPYKTALKGVEGPSVIYTLSFDGGES